MTVEQQFLQGDNVLIIAIDNPHLCLGRRLCQMIRRVVSTIRGGRITLCGNYPSDLTLDRTDVTMIPIRHLGPLQDETEFIMSFKEFENVPLLRRIRTPISHLNLFDIAAYDGLIYPYRVSCELDWSGLARLKGPYDRVIIVGGSHFNFPLPERILSALRSGGDGRAPIVGLPIGPVTGPLSPHWCDSCDSLLVTNDRMAQALKKVAQHSEYHVAESLFARVPEPVTGRPPDPLSDKVGVMVDWTFIHNWQLKVLLRELARNDLRHRIRLILTAVSEETTQMLWSKWGTILEELEPQWVYIDGDEYYRTAAGIDIVIGFVCGRDVWVWRRDRRNVILCDFAGWWRAFGFEGPAPVASPKRAVTVLDEMTRSCNRSS